MAGPLAFGKLRSAALRSQSAQASADTDLEPTIRGERMPESARELSARRGLHQEISPSEAWNRHPENVASHTGAQPAVCGNRRVSTERMDHIRHCMTSPCQRVGMPGPHCTWGGSGVERTSVLQFHRGPIYLVPRIEACQKCREKWFETTYCGRRGGRIQPQPVTSLTREMLEWCTAPCVAVSFI